MALVRIANKSQGKITEEKIKFGVGYIRCSTDKQGRDRGATLETQEKSIKNYCDKEGIYLVKIFVDEAISGRSTKGRDDYLVMIEMVQKGWYVIVFDTSRASRDGLEGIALFRDLKSRGCYLVGLDGLDSRHDDEMIAAIRFSIAQKESENTSRRVTENMRRLSEEGKLVIRPFFGWKKGEDKKLIEDEEQQKALARMFELHKEGLSPYQIAKKLNEEDYGKCINNNKTKGSKTASCKFWNTTVKCILQGHGLIPDDLPKYTIRERIDNWNKMDRTPKK